MTQRYALSEGYEVTYEYSSGKQRANVFVCGREIPCARTGWARSNRSVRSSAAKAAKADAELRAELPTLSMDGVSDGVREVLARVLGRAALPS